MPRCCLIIDGADHDVSNLLCADNQLESSLTIVVNGNGSLSSDFDFSTTRSSKDDVVDLSFPLYPNLRDPCNRRLIQDISNDATNWDIIHPKMDEKEEEYYSLQQLEEQRLQRQFQQQQLYEETSLPQRAQTAPLNQLNQSNNLYTSTDAYPSSPSPSMTARARRSSSSEDAFMTPQAAARYPRYQRQQQQPRTPGSASSRQSFTSPRSVLRRIPQRSSPAQRHSTTAVPGDIESSSSGLRPRVNYKALYGSGRAARSPPTLRTSMTSSAVMAPAAARRESSWSLGQGADCSSSGNNHSNHTRSTFMNSSTSTFLSMASSMGNTTSSSRRPSLCGPDYDDDIDDDDDDDDDDCLLQDCHVYQSSSLLDDTPVPEPQGAAAARRSSSSAEMSKTPSTMEIAPNVRVPVLGSQCSYDAVLTGDYIVATCFACANQLVCTNDAAYVLCPDCQVVSPLSTASSSTTTAGGHKKEDPYGVGTGLKREWVSDLLDASSSS